VLTENAGSTSEGDPYEMKYTDSYGNICTHFVDRPEVISNFFASSNIIDTHNQLRQDLLQLEKKWLTKNPFFCLSTMLIGVNVTNTFLLANHHKVINISNSTIGKQKISIRRFAGIISNQLIAHARRLSASSSRFLPDSPLDIIPIVSNKDSSKSGVSDLSSELYTLSKKRAVRSLQDANGKTHYLVKFDITKDPSGRSRCKKRKCKLCYEGGK
jgi:hypothetical protein